MTAYYFPQNAETDPVVAAALAALTAVVATDVELASAVATLTAGIAAKQDSANAATDAELASAVSTLNAAMATDAELASAVSTLTTSLGLKQDALTAATDAEVAAAVATINATEATETAARVAADTALNARMLAVESSRAADVPSDPFGTVAATNVQAALEEVKAEAGGTPADASTTAKGIAKITPAPADSAQPIAVGSNHSALLTGATYNPTPLASITLGDTFGGFAGEGRHLCERGGYVYTINQGGIFHVIDVSEPEDPKEVGALRDAVKFTAGFGVWALSDEIILVTSQVGNADGSGGTGAVCAINVTNKSAPSLVSGITNAAVMTTPQQIIAVGNAAYVACYGSKSVVKIDISDPANLRIISSIIDATQLNQASQMCLDGRYLHVACGTRMTTVDTVTMTVTNSQVIGTQGVAMHGRWLVGVGAGLPGTIRTYDCKNPAVPVANTVLSSALIDRPLSVSVAGDVAAIPLQSDVALVAFVSLEEPTTPVYLGRIEGQSAMATSGFFSPDHTWHSIWFGRYLLMRSAGGVGQFLVVDMTGNRGTDIARQIGALRADNARVRDDLVVGGHTETSNLIVGTGGIFSGGDIATSGKLVGALASIGKVRTGRFFPPSLLFGVTQTTMPMVVGIMYAVARIFSGWTTVAALNYELTIAGAGGANAVRLGYYRDAAGVPGALLKDLGVSALGDASAAVHRSASSTALAPGLYWEVVVLQGTPAGTATGRGLTPATGVALPLIGQASAAFANPPGALLGGSGPASGALPAAFPAVTYGGAAPAILAEIA